MTPADLIRNGQCTSSCIAATTGTSRCECPCAGQHHGLVASADVTALIEARRAGLHRLSDAEVLEAG